MAVPRKTAIIFFQPYPSLAIVCGEADVDDPEHSNTQVKIWKVTTGDLIIDHTAGVAKRNLRITGLALVEGDLYRARMRYANIDGWGPWSANAISRVPADLPYDPLTVSDEPQPVEAAPFLPEFVYPLGKARPMHDWDLQSGHMKRRPKHTRERRWVELVWPPMTLADRDTLLMFLRAKIDAGEGFIVADPIHGNINVWPRRGTMEFSLRNNAWRVRVEADETREALA